MTRPPRGPGRSADTILHTVNDLLIEAQLPKLGTAKRPSIWRGKGILASLAAASLQVLNLREATDMTGDHLNGEIS